jgi:hypothetical protein
MSEEEIFCPRCRSDGIGMAKQDCYKDLEKVGEYHSYLKYECDNCDCVFFIKDDYLSPSEQADKNIIREMLGEGETPANIAKKISRDPKWVSEIVRDLQKHKK